MATGSPSLDALIALAEARVPEPVVRPIVPRNRDTKPVPREVRQALTASFLTNPSITHAELATAFGVSRRRVGKILFVSAKQSLGRVGKRRRVRGPCVVCGSERPGSSQYCGNVCRDETRKRRKLMVAVRRQMASGLLKHGAETKDIARVLGVKQRQAHDLAGGKRGAVTRRRVEILVERGERVQQLMTKAGASQQECARILGITIKAVRYGLRALRRKERLDAALRSGTPDPSPAEQGSRPTGDP
jgi:predicted transcriptional regulator